MNAPETTEPIKLFLSHASEDKEDFVRPLVSALQEAGFTVWYDEYELTMGDSLLKKIDKGLRECNFGVVVFSKYFFEKDWTQSELDGLFTRESQSQKIILPIWKDVTKADVLEYSPMLAGRLGVPASKGIDAIVGEIQRAVQATMKAASFHTLDNAVEAFASLDRDLTGAKMARELEESAEGAVIVQEAGRQIIATLRETVEALEKTSKTLLIRIKKDSLDGPDSMTISGQYALRIAIHYGNNYSTSISDSFIGFSARQSAKEDVLKKQEFEPRFQNGGNLIWRSTDTDKQYTTEQLAAFLLKEIADTFREVAAIEENRSAR